MQLKYVLCAYELNLFKEKCFDFFFQVNQNFEDEVVRKVHVCSSGKIGITFTQFNDELIYIYFPLGVLIRKSCNGLLTKTVYIVGKI